MPYHEFLYLVRKLFGLKFIFLSYYGCNHECMLDMFLLFRFNIYLTSSTHSGQFNVTPHCVTWWLSGKESACQGLGDGFNASPGKIPWSRAWQPTAVFLPGECHGQRSLLGYSSGGLKQSDTTERPPLHCAV